MPSPPSTTLKAVFNPISLKDAKVWTFWWKSWTAAAASVDLKSHRSPGNWCNWWQSLAKPCERRNLSRLCHLFEDPLRFKVSPSFLMRHLCFCMPQPCFFIGSPFRPVFGARTGCLLFQANICFERWWSQKPMKPNAFQMKPDFWKFKRHRRYSMQRKAVQHTVRPGCLMLVWFEWSSHLGLPLVKITQRSRNAVWPCRVDFLWGSAGQATTSGDRRRSRVTPGQWKVAWYWGVVGKHQDVSEKLRASLKMFYSGHQKQTSKPGCLRLMSSLHSQLEARALVELQTETWMRWHLNCKDLCAKKRNCTLSYRII